MLCVSIFTCINGVYNENTKHCHLIEAAKTQAQSKILKNYKQPR